MNEIRTPELPFLEERKNLLMERLESIPKEKKEGYLSEALEEDAKYLRTLLLGEQTVSYPQVCVNAEAGRIERLYIGIRRSLKELMQPFCKKNPWIQILYGELWLQLYVTKEQEELSREALYSAWKEIYYWFVSDNCELFPELIFDILESCNESDFHAPSLLVCAHPYLLQEPSKIEVLLQEEERMTDGNLRERFLEVWCEALKNRKGNVQIPFQLPDAIGQRSEKQMQILETDQKISKWILNSPCGKTPGDED